MKFGSVSLILGLVLTVIVVGCGKTEEPPARKALTPPPRPPFDPVEVGKTAPPPEPERGEPNPPEPKYDQNETDSKSSDNNTSIDQNRTNSNSSDKNGPFKGQGSAKTPDGGTDGPPSVGRTLTWLYKGGDPNKRIDQIYMKKSTNIIQAVFGKPDSKEDAYWVYKGMTVKNISGGGRMTKVYFDIKNGIVVDIQARP